MSYTLQRTRSLYTPASSYAAASYGIQRITSVPSLSLGIGLTARYSTSYRPPMFAGPQHYYRSYPASFYPYWYGYRGLSYTYPASWYMERATSTYLDFLPRRYIASTYTDPIYYHRYSPSVYGGSSYDRPWWRPYRPHLYDNSDMDHALSLHKRGILSWATLDRYWLSPQYYETRLWRNRDLLYPYYHIY